MKDTRLLPSPSPGGSGTAPTSGTTPAAGPASGPGGSPETADAAPGTASATPESGSGPAPGHGASCGPAPTPESRPRLAAGRPSRTCRLFAFASGKGGVGKSLLVANLGIQLARQGRTVTLLDCDLANSTLHSFLGVGTPQACLDDLLSGRSGSLAALARDTHTPGLRLIAGSRGASRAIPAGDELESIVLKAYELPTDCLLIDLPSGRHPLTLDLLEMADCGILVTTPEPSALEGGFRLVEELARRALDRPDPGERRAAEAALGPGALVKGSGAFLDSLADIDPALAGRLGSRLARLHLLFLVNQVRSEPEAQTALGLRSMCRHYLGVELEFGGAVEFDLSAWQATRQRKSLSQKYPNAPATRTIEQIASAILTRSTLAAPRGDGNWVRLTDRTLYEILEVPASASQRDLQRAYDRLQAIASGDAEGLAHPDRRRDVSARVETAYRTLVFLESRSEYDRSLVAAGRVRQEELRDLTLEPSMTATPAGAGPGGAGSVGAASGAAGSQRAGSRPAPLRAGASGPGVSAPRSAAARAAGRGQRGPTAKAPAYGAASAKPSGFGIATLSAKGSGPGNSAAAKEPSSPENRAAEGARESDAAAGASETSAATDAAAEMATSAPAPAPPGASAGSPLPGGGSPLPGGAITLPSGASASAGGSGALHGGAAALPGSTSALPGGAGAAHGGSGPLPMGATSRPRGGAPAPPADATPTPEVMPLGAAGTPLVYSGPVLAALRHERGLSLEAIGAVTKVRTQYLRLVEEERFAELPAPIFLKGFVREYARCLSLDPVKVWQDYQARYEEWKKSRAGQS